MTRPFLLTLASILAMSACSPAAASPPPRSALIAARLLAGDSAGRKGAPAVPAREPVAEADVGAVQVYPWSEGTLYRLHAAPGQVSDIALQPGEGLISVAAGDTLRWIIGDTVSGAGATKRAHILVKPSASGLATNLVIATDRRVYHIEAESQAKAAMASLSWTYADDALLALHRPPPADEAVASGVAIEALNFGYRIEGGDVPWRPIRVFDDGRQVFIQFPPGLAQGEAPPLFVTGADGRAELVNYRVRGLYYVVDRLFAAAELRLGERRQKIVRIVRERGGRRNS